MVNFISFILIGGLIAFSTYQVVQIVRGGVIVEVADLRGFVPASQLRTGAPFDGLLNQEIGDHVGHLNTIGNSVIPTRNQLLFAVNSTTKNWFITNEHTVSYIGIIRP